MVHYENQYSNYILYCSFSSFIVIGFTHVILFHLYKKRDKNHCGETDSSTRLGCGITNESEYSHEFSNTARQKNNFQKRHHCDLIHINHKEWL